jgi:hypothetical protein
MDDKLLRTDELAVTLDVPTDRVATWLGRPGSRNSLRAILAILPIAA